MSAIQHGWERARSTFGPGEGMPDESGAADDFSALASQRIVASGLNDGQTRQKVD